MCFSKLLKSNVASSLSMLLRAVAGGRTPDASILGGGTAPVSGGPAPAIAIQVWLINKHSPHA